MPKIWLTVSDSDIIHTSLVPVEDGVEVEVPASKYRQIKAAEKRFWAAQVVLDRWLHNALNKGIKRFK